uniref:Marker of proliferation Ki-67 n=1 Tax=Oncorhynchus mykiss TaxID=8022 RepID=A0A8K9WV29_ONCMY
MSLHGKIVVIKRSGGDGTEFPLTASCLFGRKPDCDIRIQLPHVSKEHCRIELNENKEVILTNLSSTNPTRVNGEVFQQSERLKHGDLITIIDRSFRFEYPPAPTPKKNRYSTVLHETQARDTSAKDGTNTSDVKPKEDGLGQNKPSSPFCELYQMFKQDLDSKTPKKALGTPASRLCPQNPISTRKVDGASVISTPKKAETENVSPVPGVTPKSAQKKRKSLKGRVVEGNVPVEDFIQLPPSILETPKGKRRSSKSITPTTVEEKSAPVSQRKSHLATPEKFTASEVAGQISEEATPIKSLITGTEHSRSPRPAGEKLQAQDVCPLSITDSKFKADQSTAGRRYGDLETEFPTPLCKRKRVSFGGHLEPELFDKRLPPDSPLCKGATPGRRSLCAPKMKQSLLRRASAIGLIKVRKKATPSPAKKSPKASPKTPSPAKKSPKASPKTPSPAKKSPKSPKAKTPSPGKEKTPKTAVKTPSPARRKSALKDESQTPKAGKTPKTPASLPSANTTPTMQGRFSVSLVSTPSPTADQDSVLQPSVTVTPRVPLRRTTMSSTSKTTQKSTLKNSLQVIRRRSGVSRASMKVVNSWADIVKFGQTKTQAVIPTKKTTRVTKTKTVVPKPKTPVRKLIGHVSTGHADSPVTIVVGKAHRLKAIQPSGAAPKLVHNMAVLKKNMRMDEDLSGIADIFKTPARQRKSVVNVQSALKTPLRAQSTSMIESSVMNTPEETGEMVVSPLVVSTAKRGAYNSDAVTRLLRDGQESSFITEEADDSRTTQNEILALEMSSEESKEEQRPESKKSISTPKQKKPEQPECLTGVKRIMKTPRQKVQPIEDLRGKLMTTPRGPKASQEVSLVGVKELLTTPKQIAEPVEEMSGKVQDDNVHSETKEVKATRLFLCTPTPKRNRSSKQNTPRGPKALQKVSLDVVKTPKHVAQPVEEISGDAQEIPDAMTTEAVEELAAALAEAVEEEQPAPLAEAVQEVEEPVSAPAEAVEEEQPALLAEAVQEVEEPVSAPAEAVEEEQPALLAEAVQEVETVSAPAEAVQEVETVSAPAEAVQEVETVSAPAEAVQEVEEPAFAPAEAVEEEQPAPLAEPVAAPAEAVRMAHLDSEEPSVPVKGRVKKTEGIVPPPARGRSARCNETSSVEAPAETMDSVDVQEKMAVDPVPAEKLKRGRKAKQASVERVESVQENAVESESAEIPPIEDQQPTSDVPVEKPRRGRKSVSVETPIEQVEAQEQATVAPVEKPKRGGRKTKQASVEQVEDHPVDSLTVELQEQTTVAPVEKPKRGGRKTKQASIEKVEPVADHPVECLTVELQEQTTVAPVEKPKRGGRKTKQASVEQVEDHPVESLTVELQEQTTVAPVEKPKRGGRKTKQASVEKVEPVEDHPIQSLTVEAKEQTTVAPVEKPKRGGRKTKQASVEQVEPVEDHPVESLTVEVEAQEQTTVAPVEKPKRGGRKTKQASVEQVEDHPIESLTVEAKEQTTVAPVEKPKRGGRKTKQASVEQVEPVEDHTVETLTVELQEQTTLASVEKPKRVGRRTKQDPGLVEREEAVADAEELLEAPVVKPGWRRKAKAVVKDEVPAKRARRGAADSTKVPTVAEATVEVPSEPVKRGRRAAKSKVSADETTIAAESTPLEAEVMTAVVRRGKAPKKGNAVSETTSDQANSIEGMETIDEDSKTSKSVNWKPDLEVTYKVTPLPKQKTSRRNDTVPVTKVEEQPERSEEQQVVKTVRGRRARSYVAVKEETVQSTPSKRARHSNIETSAAEATVPISKPVNERNAARSMTTEEADLSDKAVPKEPVKKTRRAAKSTAAAPVEATSTTPAVPEGETIPDATVVAATKGRGKATKGKTVSQEIDIEQSTESEQPCKPRRGRAARK